MLCVAKMQPIRQQTRQLTTANENAPWRLIAWLTNLAACLCGPREKSFITLNDDDDFLVDK